jgi:hypothetical protein
MDVVAGNRTWLSVVERIKGTSPLSIGVRIIYRNRPLQRGQTDGVSMSLSHRSLVTAATLDNRNWFDVWSVFREGAWSRSHVDAWQDAGPDHYEIHISNKPCNTTRSRGHEGTGFPTPNPVQSTSVVGRPIGATQSNKENHVLAPRDEGSSPDLTAPSAGYARWRGGVPYVVSSSDELIIIPGGEEANKLSVVSWRR